MTELSNIALQRFIDRLLQRSVLGLDEQNAILGLPSTLVKFSRKANISARHRDGFSSLIVSGIVGRYALDPEGGRQFIAFHLAGDMADLTATVRPIETDSLSALCDTVVMQIPHDALRALVAKYPAIAEAFWRDSALDAAVLAQWILNVGSRNSESRIAHFICEMATRCGIGGQPSDSFEFRVTQEEIADACGITAVHTNRTLRALSAIMTFKSKRVDIHDWHALTKRGGFSSDYLISDTRTKRRLLQIVQ